MFDKFLLIVIFFSDNHRKIRRYQNVKYLNAKIILYAEQFFGSFVPLNESLFMKQALSSNQEFLVHAFCEVGKRFNIDCLQGVIGLKVGKPI